MSGKFYNIQDIHSLRYKPQIETCQTEENEIFLSFRKNTSLDYGKVYEVGSRNDYGKKNLRYSRGVYKSVKVKKPEISPRLNFSKKQGNVVSYLPSIQSPKSYNRIVKNHPYLKNKLVIEPANRSIELGIFPSIRMGFVNVKTE